MFCHCKNLKEIKVNKNTKINFLENEFKENNINPEIIYTNLKSNIQSNKNIDFHY